MHLWKAGVTSSALLNRSMRIPSLLSEKLDYIYANNPTSIRRIHLQNRTDGGCWSRFRYNMHQFVFHDDRSWSQPLLGQ